LLVSQLSVKLSTSVGSWAYKEFFALIAVPLVVVLLVALGLPFKGHGGTCPQGGAYGMIAGPNL
jgi:hypothetical protein